MGRIEDTVEYKAIYFQHPERIPMTWSLNDSCWHHYPQDWLCEMIETHPWVCRNKQIPEVLKNGNPTGAVYVPNYGPNARKDHPYTDDFGCVWKTLDDGITGSVVGHPLANWDNYDSYVFPDPDVSNGLKPIDWEWEKKNVEKKHAAGRLAYGNLRHGHTFLQLSDMCGYENLLFSMIDEEPKLFDLIDRLEEFNCATIRHFIDCGIDVLGVPEDLGMQHGPMISPDLFKKYIKPSYKHMLSLAREKGLPVKMHSDGDIRTLVDDLIDSGVVILNLQDLVNGIDWIQANVKGRVCIDLDVDRQNITVLGTPQQCDRLIYEEVTKLGSKEGGLSMFAELDPQSPMENVKAVLDAMEKYSTYYSD